MSGKANNTRRNDSRSIIKVVQTLPPALLNLFYNFFVDNDFLADKDMTKEMFSAIFLKDVLYVNMTYAKLKKLYNLYLDNIQLDITQVTWLKYFKHVFKKDLKLYKLSNDNEFKIYENSSYYVLKTFYNRNWVNKSIDAKFKNLKHNVLEIFKN